MCQIARILNFAHGSVANGNYYVYTYKIILLSNIANIKLRNWNELAGASNIAKIKFRAWVRTCIMDMIQIIFKCVGIGGSVARQILWDCGVARTY